MADSQKYYDCGKPTLIQGGWQRAGAGNAYVEFQASTTRISTLDFVPTGHPNNIKVTGIASKTLEVSALALRNDNYIIEAYGWQANGAEFNVGDSYDKLGIMFRFQDNSDITPSDVEVQELGEWKHSLRKLTTATEVVENPLYSDGTAITAYTIKGNTVQSGTPTPSVPISVQGVGNKTANLFDYKAATYGTWTNSNGSTISAGYAARSASLNAETITVSCNGETKPYSYSIVWLDGNDTFISREHVGLASMIALPQTFTPPNNAVKYYMQVANGSDTSNPITESQLAGYKIMLNTGSTAQSYELYGYKIPVSSGQQTIDIYIGDLPLLKSLDGTAVDEISNGTLTRRVDSDGSVLPTPTTTQITMPSIPTADGANSITVDTTVQPSEFTATWTGWHDSQVKEKSENLFNVNTGVRGYYINASGVEVANTSSEYEFAHTQKIPVEPNMIYTYSLSVQRLGMYRRIIGYDANGDFIEQITDFNITALGYHTTTITTPQNCYYITINYVDDAYNNADLNMMLNKGSTALPYEPYWK